MAKKFSSLNRLNSQAAAVQTGDGALSGVSEIAGDVKTGVLAGLDSLLLGNLANIESIGETITGDDRTFEELQEKNLQEQRAREAASPTSASLGNIVGTIGGLAIPGLGAAKALKAAKGLSTAGKLLRGAGVGAATGGATGFLQAPTTPEGSRIEQAITGAGLGAVTGGAIVPALGGIAKFAGKGLKRFAGLSERQIKLLRNNKNEINNLAQKFDEAPEQIDDLLLNKSKETILTLQRNIDRNFDKVASSLKGKTFALDAKKINQIGESLASGAEGNPAVKNFMGQLIRDAGPKGLKFLPSGKILTSATKVNDLRKLIDDAAKFTLKGTPADKALASVSNSLRNAIRGKAQKAGNANKEISDMIKIRDRLGKLTGIDRFGKQIAGAPGDATRTLVSTGGKLKPIVKQAEKFTKTGIKELSEQTGLAKELSRGGGGTFGFSQIVRDAARAATPKFRTLEENINTPGGAAAITSAFTRLRGGQ